MVWDAELSPGRQARRRGPRPRRPDLAARPPRPARARAQGPPRPGQRGGLQRATAASRRPGTDGTARVWDPDGRLIAVTPGQQDELSERRVHRRRHPADHVQSGWRPAPVRRAQRRSAGGARVRAASSTTPRSAPAGRSRRSATGDVLRVFPCDVCGSLEHVREVGALPLTAAADRPGATPVPRSRRLTRLLARQLAAAERRVGLVEHPGRESCVPPPSGASKSPARVNRPVRNCDSRDCEPFPWPTAASSATQIASRYDGRGGAVLDLLAMDDPALLDQQPVAERPVEIEEPPGLVAGGAQSPGHRGSP